MTVALETTGTDRSGWARRIGAAWGSVLENVLATGRTLVEAKEALPHGEFEAMVAADLPFSARSARMLMTIAQDGRLLNRKHVSVLPPSWGTLYELTKLDDQTFEAAVETGAIRPDMERKDAALLRTAERRELRLERTEEISRASKPLAQTVQAGRRYPLLYLDPPWMFKTFSELGKQKSPENHYPTMTIEALKEEPVGDLAADSAALFMWTTGGHLAMALDLMAHWGFVYKSHVVWLKTNPDGSPHRGTGYWFINTHELLLLGTRGDMPAPLMGSQEESVIQAPAGRHSEKPAIFREMIERYFPDVGRIELYRRGPKLPGWDVWGNEAEAA